MSSGSSHKVPKGLGTSPTKPFSRMIHPDLSGLLHSLLKDVEVDVMPGLAGIEITKFLRRGGETSEEQRVTLSPGDSWGCTLKTQVTGPTLEDYEFLVIEPVGGVAGVRLTNFSEDLDWTGLYDGDTLEGSWPPSSPGETRMYGLVGDWSLHYLQYLIG